MYTLYRIKNMVLIFPIFQELTVTWTSNFNKEEKIEACLYKSEENETKPNIDVAVD